MALLHLPFDNDRPTGNRETLLMYRGRRFKLVEDADNFADAILTEFTDEKDAAEAFSTISEFLSAFAWESGARIAMGLPATLGSFDGDISGAHPFVRPTRRISRSAIFTSSFSIAYLETPDQIEATTLFRDAESSNHSYGQMLLYWSAIQVGNATNASDWIDATVDSGALDNELQLCCVPTKHALGDYLHDDIRNAIAHYYRRRRGSRSLRLYSYSDARRLADAVWIVRICAKHYIRHALGVRETLSPLRRGDDTFLALVDRAGRSV